MSHTSNASGSPRVLTRNPTCAKCGGRGAIVIDRADRDRPGSKNLLEACSSCNPQRRKP